MTKKNLHERAEMVRAMERIARSLNDEMVFESWLIAGVADEDIDGQETDEDLDYYCEDENYAELIGLFLRLMRRAGEGGLYSNGIVSK